jgi:creatinine amidohydrolase
MTKSYSSDQPLRLKEMRHSEIQEALERDSRLIVPVGCNQAHGPHLPLGTGTIIAERLADELSARFGVLRAPVLEYGVNIASDSVPPGSASLRRKTLHRVLNELLAQWESVGVSQFILLTANGYDPHLDAMSMVSTANSEVRVVDLLATGIGDLLEAKAAPLIGDEADTSLMLYIAPSLVLAPVEDYTVAAADVRRYRGGPIALPRGTTEVLCRASLASAEKGEVIFRRIYERVASRVFARDIALEIGGD